MTTPPAPLSLTLTAALKTPQPLLAHPPLVGKSQHIPSCSARELTGSDEAGSNERQAGPRAHRKRLSNHTGWRSTVGAGSKALAHCTSAGGAPHGCRMTIVIGMAQTQLRIMGAHEIRMRLGGLSRQRVYQITSRDDSLRPSRTWRRARCGSPPTWRRGLPSTDPGYPDSPRLRRHPRRTQSGRIRRHPAVDRATTAATGTARGARTTPAPLPLVQPWCRSRCHVLLHSDGRCSSSG